MMCIAKIADVHARAHLQRQRRVERPAGGGRAAGHEERADQQHARPAVSSQKLKLFMRANAMSDAPICSGIIQFAKPTKAGMIAPNTMIRPCMVVSWLKSSGLTNCRPGLEQLGADQQRQHAADHEHGEREHRYSVPMSLWLVAYTQRVSRRAAVVVVRAVAVARGRGRRGRVGCAHRRAPVLYRVMSVYFAAAAM